MPAEHDELVMRIGRVASVAGVPESAIYATPLSAHCGEQERRWFRRHRRLADEGVARLAYLGTQAVEQRMAALAGAFLHNFVDARILRGRGVLRLIAKCAANCTA